MSPAVSIDSRVGSENPIGVLIVQQVETGLFRAAESCQYLKGFFQKVVQAAGFQLGPRQLVEGLGFGFAHLIVGFVECKANRQLKLIQRPMVFAAAIRQAFQHWRKQ